MKTINPAPTKPEKSIVVFEVTDPEEAKPGTYRFVNKRDGEKYIPQFREFIEALGYELAPIGETSFDTSTIHIGEATFLIDTDNAARYSKNIYKREVNERKMENRFIRLMQPGYEAPAVFRIVFNKEYDANVLREKIDAEIKRQAARDAKWEEAKQLDIDNAILIGQHYSTINSFGLGQLVRRITVEKGLFFFHTPVADIQTDLHGRFTQLQIYQQKTNQGDTNKNVQELVIKMVQDLQNITTIITAIEKIPALPQSVIEWAQKASYKGFDYTDNTPLK